MRWHLSASLAMHAAILVCLLLLQSRPSRPLLGDEAVSVQLVARPFPRRHATTEKDPTSDAARRSGQSRLTAETIIHAARNKQAKKAAPATERRAPKPDPDGLTVAKQFYAERLLSDRHNKSALEAMRQLAGDERIIQLCNVEAMEQVRRAKANLKPDYVIAYAMADVQLSGHGVEAEGGAFYSHRNWYGLAFKCDVSADASKVVSFAFRVGQPIPRTEWAGHNLTSDTGSED